jgi:hypothetical protein
MNRLTRGVAPPFTCTTQPRYSLSEHRSLVRPCSVQNISQHNETFCSDYTQPMICLACPIRRSTC